MPRKDAKGDVRTAASVSVNSAASPTDTSSATSSQTNSASASKSPIVDCSDAFLHLLTRDDGWLRVVPHEMGAVTYYKWKFTRGAWSGYYVMYRSDNLDFIAAMVGLYRKLLKVDAGLERPVYDVPYNS